MTLLLLLALAGVAAGAAPVESTNDHDEVRAHIISLFDAMRAGDAEALAAHFHESATLYSVGHDAAGTVRVRSEDLQRFFAAVAAATDVLDERLGPMDVQVDGDLATSFMPYAFYVGERFSHCGANAFHLVRTSDGWRTLHITDTRRTGDCHPSVSPTAG